MWIIFYIPLDFLVAQMVKRLPKTWETGFDPWVGKIPWRRKWQPTPVFLPGKSHGWRSLVGYSPWGHKESGTTKWLHFLFALCMGYQDWPLCTHIVCTLYCLHTSFKKLWKVCLHFAKQLLNLKDWSLWNLCGLYPPVYAPSLSAVRALYHLILESCCFLVSYL